MTTHEAKAAAVRGNKAIQFLSEMFAIQGLSETLARNHACYVVREARESVAAKLAQLPTNLPESINAH